MLAALHHEFLVLAGTDDNPRRMILGQNKAFLEIRDTPLVRRVTEALLAARLLEPGVYVAMHNRVLRFPGVTKDRQALSFVRND